MFKILEEYLAPCTSSSRNTKQQHTNVTDSPPLASFMKQKPITKKRRMVGSKNNKRKLSKVYDLFVINHYIFRIKLI